MRRAALSAAAAAAVLAGCGGGSGGGGGDRLSATDYRDRAAKICQEAERQTDALGRPKTTSEFKTFLAKGVVITDRNLKRFEALKPPADLEDEHEAIVSGERRSLERLRRLSSRLHGDARDVGLLRRTQPELTKLNTEANERFRAAGLDACAQA